MYIKSFIVSIFTFLSLYLHAEKPAHTDIVVDINGSGDFKSLTEAITALPMYTYERVVIYIKNGIYEEKIRIVQDNITLVGQDKEGTIIRFNQLREDWENNKDFIGPAVVNIHADDVILKDLTIINTQPKVGPHAFTIYGTGTRTVIVNCNVMSKGGDTVSLWNYKKGMYYHTGCYFEGAVDFVCPRGWCYISDSRLYELKETAAIWHAAVTDPRQKFVIKNSHFDGVKGFQLGRHHYEAQFYLLECTFSHNMADTPIYRVVQEDPSQNRPYFWGDRYYYRNCKGERQNYSWFEDNMPDSLSQTEINAYWTFDNTWDPESSQPPRLISWEIKGDNLFLNFSESLTIRGNPVLKTASGHLFTFEEGRGRKTLRFSFEKSYDPTRLTEPVCMTGGSVLATMASVEERMIPSCFLLQ